MTHVKDNLREQKQDIRHIRKDYLYRLHPSDTLRRVRGAQFVLHQPVVSSAQEPYANVYR